MYWQSQVEIEHCYVQHFECGNVVKICNGITFGFYLGLPLQCHM